LDKGLKSDGIYKPLSAGKPFNTAPLSDTNLLGELVLYNFIIVNDVNV
jgi:hypothetical protein